MNSELFDKHGELEKDDWQEMLEDDELSAAEEGFMIGYWQAENEGF